MSLIEGRLSIEPAYKKRDEEIRVVEEVKEVKDKNSLISILMKKGEKKIEVMELKGKRDCVREEKKMGPAETKLKSIFKKEVKFIGEHQPKKASN